MDIDKLNVVATKKRQQFRLDLAAVDDRRIEHKAVCIKRTQRQQSRS